MRLLHFLFPVWLYHADLKRSIRASDEEPLANERNRTSLHIPDSDLFRIVGRNHARANKRRRLAGKGASARMSAARCLDATLVDERRGVRIEVELAFFNLRRCGVVIVLPGPANLALLYLIQSGHERARPLVGKFVGEMLSS